MNARLQEIAEATARDSHSGASEMLLKAATSILALSEEDVDAIPASEWTGFGISLHRAKPTIATLFNLANDIMLEAEQGMGRDMNVRSAVADMMEREKRSIDLITEAAGNAIEAEWIATSSYSSTVSRALEEIASRRPLRVTVAESLPGGEGRRFAKRLSDHGIDSEIVPDSNLFARMAEADCALTGADSITPDGLVNKVGTRVLVEAARCCGRPSYAACSGSKMSPVVLSNMIISQRKLSERLSERSQLFESTPLDRITCVITESGAFAPGGLLTKLRDRKVAAAWSSLGMSL